MAGDSNMKVYNGIVKMKDTCVVYGDFDGVHRGHKRIIEKAVEISNKNGLQAVVLSKISEKDYLTNKREKEYLFEKIDNVEAIVFSDAENLLEIALNKLGAKIIVVGENHKDLETVLTKGKETGVTVVVCDTEKEGGKTITTEMIRKAFEDSDFETVTKLCGHPYIMIGEVQHGKALGRTVGMPTANIGSDDGKLKPPSGVYATSVYIDDEVYKAMTNIGKRPSVDDFDYLTIEAFILDFSRNIYGKEVVLEIFKYVRGVKKFDSLEEVQKQVQKDIEKVREIAIVFNV